MRKTLNGAIVALGIAGAALLSAGPATAQDVGAGVHVGGVGVGVTVGVGPSDVRYGYQDGYWDTGHQWHNWRNEQDMRDYRKSKNSNYNDWKHDRDSDQGWHS
jgi:hypothetical protein